MSNWVIETLIATTILMVAVLALREVVSVKFGPRVAYLLWLAPALRMALPPLPPSWFGTVDAPVQSVVVVLEGASSLSFQPTTAAGSGIPWIEIALAVWLGGAALFFLWHTARYIYFARRVMARAQPLFDHDAIRIATSSAVTSPIAFGIFGKAVLVPADFEHRFSSVEQRLAIAHKVTHHVRRDLPVNLAALGMLALHWFNPVAHVAHRAFRLDQEASCDAIVLDGATPDERHAYGSALFKSATGAVPYAVCAMGSTAQLKVRLRRIICAPKSSPLLGTTMAITSLLIVGGVLATASGSAAADAIDVAKHQAESAIESEFVSAPAVAVAEARVEKAEQDAEAAADAADDTADKASSDIEHALADRMRADADRLRAEADRIQAQADDLRAQAAVPADIVISAAPSPPAPPSAIAIAQAPAAPAPLAATKINCPRNQHAQIISKGTVTDGKLVQGKMIVICRDRIAALVNKSVIAGLQSARAEIAGQMNNSDGIEREALGQALASLDRSIATERARLIEPE